jgi:hypothetical protein
MICIKYIFHLFLKRILIVSFIAFNVLIFSQELPHPKDQQLYTEFTSQRMAAYLKKPIISEGYIVMNGSERFTFKQSKPTLIEIKKTGGKIIYKRENMDPIVMDASGQMTADTDNIMFLFSNDQNIKDKFEINIKKINEKDEFTIIPNKKEKVDKITVMAIDDKIESIRIQFLNKSTLVYQFKNTVTGVVPDDKFF